LQLSEHDERQRGCNNRVHCEALASPSQVDADWRGGFERLANVRGAVARYGWLR
jgi:hypothetical protein